VFGTEKEGGKKEISRGDLKKEAQGLITRQAGKKKSDASIQVNTSLSTVKKKIGEKKKRKHDYGKKRKPKYRSAKQKRGGQSAQPLEHPFSGGQRQPKKGSEKKRGTQKRELVRSQGTGCGGKQTAQSIARKVR